MERTEERGERREEISIFCNNSEKQNDPYYHLIRAHRFRQQNGRRSAGEKFSISRSNYGKCDSDWHQHSFGSTYTFTIERWAKRGFNSFLRMFHSIARDSALYGVMTEKMPLDIVSSTKITLIYMIMVTKLLLRELVLEL